MPATSRQHRSPDGEWRPCRARTRGCKFAEHRGGVDGGAGMVAATLAPNHTKHADAPALPFELLGEEQDYWREWPAEIRLAPAGATGKFCHGCDNYFSPAEWAKLDEGDSLWCAHCRDWITGNDQSVDFRADELRYLDDAQVRSAHWFHISEHAHWDASTKAEGVYTHLGSKEAAMERLLALRAQQLKVDGEAEQYYLHEVELSPSATVAPGVYHDQLHGWPEYVRAPKKNVRAAMDMAGHSTLRYMNQYEGPGTVSLLADPSSYALVASVAIPRV